MVRRQIKLFSLVIVSYNPDKRLLENIKVISSSNYIRDILIIDNSTLDSEVVSKCKAYSKVKLISCGGNKGIAYAQNLGILKSKELGYDWTLLLDHDTIINAKLINKYFDFINKNRDNSIAIVSTDYYDVGRKRPILNNKRPINVSVVISSGSLINIDTCLLLGGMKEHYFIDQVDNEYCYRVNQHKYRIIALPEADMEHRLGNLRKINMGLIHFYTYNQQPIRTFFRTRNCIYFMREYRNLNLSINIIHSLFKDVFRILFEKDMLTKFKYFCRGLLNGFKDKIPSNDIIPVHRLINSQNNESR